MLINSIIILGILVLLVVTFIIGLFTYYEIFSPSTWKSVDGIIQESRIVSNKKCNGLPGFHYHVVYRFSISGIEYTESTVRSGGFKYYSKSKAEEISNKYPVGANVKVYYDGKFEPAEDTLDNPVALLEPGFNLECLYPLAILTILVLLDFTLMLVLIQRLGS